MNDVFPWILIVLLLATCVYLIIAMLKQRDRAVNAEAQLQNLHQQSEFLAKADEQMQHTFAGLSSKVFQESSQQFLTLAKESLKNQNQEAEHQLEDKQKAIDAMLKPIGEALQTLQTRLAEIETNNTKNYSTITAQIQTRDNLYAETEKALKEAFAGLSTEALNNSGQQLLRLATQHFETQHTKANSELEARKTAIDTMLKPISEALGLMQERIGQIEKDRTSSYTELLKQLEFVSTGTNKLREETGRLTSALHNNKARGQWGELQLQRVVELAGLVEHCDFKTQVSTSTEDSTQRPDMVINLPGDRNIIIDAKAPMEAFLKAIEAENEVEKKRLYAQHAADLKVIIQQLAKRNYSGKNNKSPDFVILFLPAEAFFYIALEHEPTLIEYSTNLKIILATPTTLIAMLKTIAHSWTQAKMAENAQKISDAGKDLYDACATFVEHIGKMGKNLGQTIDNYNKAINSFNRTVGPKARKLTSLGVTSNKEVKELDNIESTPNLITDE